MTIEERISLLEDQIEKLYAKQAELRKELAKAQLDQWQARIEDLEVQMHLGAMDANDKVAALMRQVRDKWSDARRQFDEAASTASGMADAVRTGLETAIGELRKALLDYRKQFS